MLCFRYPVCIFCVGEMEVKCFNDLDLRYLLSQVHFSSLEFVHAGLRFVGKNLLG